MDGVRKLIPAWVGPFAVTRVCNAVTCVLDLPDDMRCGRSFHVALLKHYHPLSRVAVPPQPTMVDDHDEYEVESILNHRHRKLRNGATTLEFRVSFKGYEPHRNLWLPATPNLAHCPGAVADYWRRVQLQIGARAIHGVCLGNCFRVVITNALVLICHLPDCHSMLTGANATPYVACLC